MVGWLVGYNVLDFTTAYQQSHIHFGRFYFFFSKWLCVNEFLQSLELSVKLGKHSVRSLRLPCPIHHWGPTIWHEKNQRGHTRPWTSKTSLCNMNWICAKLRLLIVLQTTKCHHFGQMQSCLPKLYVVAKGENRGTKERIFLAMGSQRINNWNSKTFAILEHNIGAFILLEKGLLDLEKFNTTVTHLKSLCKSLLFWGLTRTCHTPTIFLKVGFNPFRDR